MEPIQILALLMLGVVVGGYLTKSAQRQAWLKARAEEEAKARAAASGTEG